MSNEERNTKQFVFCPNCGALTTIGIYKDTVLINYPLCCPECQKETLINIIRLQMTKIEDE